MKIDLKCVVFFYRTPEGLTEQTVPLLTKLNSITHSFIVCASWLV